MKEYEYKYEIDCSNCGHYFEVESEFTLTYEDVTCPKCNTYENLFLYEVEA